MGVIAYLVTLSTRRYQFPLSIGASVTTAGWFTYLLTTDARVRWGALAIASGVLWYTFVEYVYHRWVAHRLLGDIPEVHHARPDNYFAAPWFLVPPTAYALYLVVAGLVSPAFALRFMVGVAWGHLWQEFVHWVAHHVEWTFPLPMQTHHAIHHLYETRNFGHSTTLWDRVFRTIVR